MRTKFLSFIGLCTVALWLRHMAYQRSLEPVNAADHTRVIVTIPSGLSTGQIAALLEEHNVIRSAGAFSRYARAEGSDQRLQAGSFVLMPSMSVVRVIEALSSGVAAEAIVTIPEGLTVTEMDALLAEKGLIDAGSFLTCAQTCDLSAFTFLPSDTEQAARGGRVEGYLFPDTYFIVTTDFNAETFLRRLLATFEQRVVRGLADELRAGRRSMRDIIIMASLIEKETRIDEERSVVSGILWKRYDEHMGLGVDAAVRYILHKPTGALTRADLDIDSPYNLRKYRGLTPGPIANPGLKSILAALRPEESPYYYYLHGSDGVIRYAVTNDEHNANKARYLRN